MCGSTAFAALITRYIWIQVQVPFALKETLPRQHFVEHCVTSYSALVRPRRMGCQILVLNPKLKYRSLLFQWKSKPYVSFVLVNALTKPLQLDMSCATSMHSHFMALCHV